MAATKYTFSVADDFSAGVALAEVVAEIDADPGITTAVDTTLTKCVGDVFDLWFDDVLSSSELTALHGDASPPAEGSVLGDHLGPQDPPAVVVSAAFEARLSVTSAATPTMEDAVTTTDQTEIDVYLLPHKGEQIALYDGTVWGYHALGANGITIDNTGLTADKNYDVWVYDNSGALTLELLAWTNDTTRATALAVQDGVYVKTGATTRRYVGTVRTIDVGGTVKFTDTETQRFAWNYYNRRRRFLRGMDSGSAWTLAYNTAARGLNNGDVDWKLEFVTGLDEDVVTGLISGLRVVTTSTVGAYIGFGLDTVSAIDTTNGHKPLAPSSAGTYHPEATWAGHAGIGYHYLQGLEEGVGSSGSSTLVGTTEAHILAEVWA